MKSLIFQIAFLALLSPTSMRAVAQASSDAKEIKDIKELLTDTAAGHISAASLLGIGGDAVNVVENNRTLVAALSGLGTKGTQAAFSFTPARSSLLPMSLSTYAKPGLEGVGYRLLGNLSLSYAQGTSKVSNIDMSRRAVSIETNISYREQDPIIAIHDSCIWEAPIAAPGTDANYSESNKKYTDCIVKKESELAKKWNISRLSLAWGTGSISPDSGTRTSMGQTLAGSLTYGFDHVGIQALKEGGAITFTFRRAHNEPILSELAKGIDSKKDSNLSAVRLTAGSSNARILAEVSNARSSNLTASDMVYKKALGIDVKLAEGTWLNLRTGKQHKADGSGEETATLMNISFSPKAGLF